VFALVCVLLTEIYTFRDTDQHIRSTNALCYYFTHSSNLSDGLLYSMQGVSVIDFSTANNLLVTGSRDCTIRGWNVYATDHPVMVLRGHEAPIMFLYINETKVYVNPTCTCLMSGLAPMALYLADDCCLVTNARPIEDCTRLTFVYASRQSDAHQLR